MTLSDHTRPFDRTRWWIGTVLLTGLFLAFFLTVVVGLAVIRR